MKKICLACILLLVAAHCYPQEINKEQLCNTIREIVGDLQYHLEIMADGTHKKATRFAARDAAKKMFANKGGNYSYMINGQTYYDKCEVEMINKHRPQYVYKKCVNAFLDVLVNLPTRFKIVDWTFMSLDSLKKVGENTYACVAHIGMRTQNVIRYNNGEYRDSLRINELRFKDVEMLFQIDICGTCYNCGESCVLLEDIRVETISDLPMEFE